MTVQREGTPLESDDIRQIILDVIAPLKADISSVKDITARIERTAIQRIEYEPQILALQNDIKRLRRSNAALRKRIENIWTRLLLTLGGAAALIFTLIQISDRVSIH
jgi:hypothetical protein